MDIPLNVDVTCTDGLAGRSLAIIMNPANNQVTHIAVQGHGDFLGEYLVPIEAIASSTPHQIQLLWTTAQFAQAARFDKTVFVGDESDEAIADATVWAYAATGEMGFGAAPLAPYVLVEDVPASELAVHRGAHVDATDGRVGQVDEFLVDPQTNKISHIVLHKGHLWGKRSITVPISAIDHVADDVVHLNLDKAAIEALPSIPMSRR